MKKTLFIEQHWDAQKVELLESGGSKRWIVSGKFTKCDIPNDNNRVYPKNEMQQAIEKCRKKVHAGKVKMALDHPDMFEGSKLANTAAILLDISDVDSEGYATYKAQICDTSKGKDLKAIIDAGGVVGVSTRGYGMPMFDQDIPGHAGKFTVIKDYTLETIDFVDDPSVKETEDGVTVESTQRSQKKMKTLEELKKENPEVFATLEKEHNDAINALAEKAKGLETTVEKLTKDFNAIVEAVKLVKPEAFTTMPETDLIKTKDTEIASAKESLEAAKKELDAVKTTISTLESEKVKIEKEKEIEKLRAEDPTYFGNEALVKRFENCTTSQEIRKVYEANKEVFADFLKKSATTEVPDAPKTKTSESNGMTDAQKKDFESRNADRRAGGLPSLTVEQYLKDFGK